MTTRPLHVLLVDDEASLREPLAKYLRQSYSYEVDVAATGSDALARVTEHVGQYDVLLLDYILMPAVDCDPEPLGIQLMTKIQRQSPQTECILFTGWDVDVGLEALRAGAYRYIHKPFDHRELGAMIEHAAEHARLKSAAREKQILQQLMEISTALHSGRSLPEILDTVLRGVQAIGFDRVRLYLLSADGQFLEGSAQEGMENQDFSRLRIPVAEDVYMQILLREPRPWVFERKPNEALPYEQLLDKENVNQWACVPLMVGKQVIGKLSVDNKTSQRPIIEAELGPVALFAAQAAAVIQNVRLMEETQAAAQQVSHHARNLAAIQEVSRAISSLVDYNAIFQAACKAVVELFIVSHSGLVRFDDDYKKGQVVAEYPQWGAIGTEIPVQGTPAEERLVTAQEPIVIADVANEVSLGSVREVLAHLKVCSILIVPVVSKGRVLASFSLDMTGQQRVFTADEVELCKVFAAQVAAILENARLFAEVKQQKDHWQRLIANAPTGVIAADRYGVITNINDRVQTVLNYSAEEVIGKPIDEFYLDPREPRQVGKLLHQSTAGKLSNYPSIICSKNNERIPIRLSATWLYDGQKKRIGSVGYFEDMRFIQEAEKRLELLLKASNVVAQAQDLSEGLQRLAELLVTFLGVSFGGIELLDESGEYLVAEAAFPDADAQFAWNPRLGDHVSVQEWEGLAEFLARSDYYMIRMDDERQRAQLLEISRQHQSSQTIQSMLFLPLRTRQRTVGLFFLAEVRHWQQAPFSSEKVNLASAIAEQTAVLIDRMRLHASTERRGKLLAALDETLRHIRGEKETTKLLQEMVRLAAELLGCRAGGLYSHRPRLREIEAQVTYGLSDKLPSNVLDQIEELVKHIAHTGQPANIHIGVDQEPVIGVPLKHAGEVEAVLFVIGGPGAHLFSKTDQEILHRFATQAAIALQTSRLLTQEQRMVGKLTILHKISDYIQAAADLEKILHVVLTGVTAGYSLGFNRAALFLLDEKRETLVGRIGIGHLEEEKARQDWSYDQTNGLQDFNAYLALLEGNALSPAPIDQRIRGLCLPVKTDDPDLFSRVVQEQYYIRVRPVEFATLPDAFLKNFEPALPLIVIPLIVRGKVIGLLVCDNKFTQSPITNEDAEALQTFANTAAIAIDKTQLLRETEAARQRLQSFYAASNALVSSQDPDQVLDDIVEQARVTANARAASILLINESGGVRNLATAGCDKGFDIEKAMRPNGISMQVMRSGKAEFIENTDQERHRVNPAMLRDRIAAAACLPLSARAKTFGVMWLHYDHPRYFSLSEREALQLFVNQAAIGYENARQMAEIDRTRQIAEVLAAAAEALAGAAGTQEVLKQIVQSARQVLGADSTAIWSYDAVRDQFILTNSVADGILESLWEEFRSEEPRRGQTAHTVMQYGWIGVEDMSDSQHYVFLGESTRRLLYQIGVQSFQGIALCIGDEKLGVLYVNYNQVRSFRSEEKETARTFANHAALALKKARLLEQVNQARDTARVVAKVTSLGNLQETLRSIAMGSRDVLDCDAVTVYVYNPESDELLHPPIMEDVRNPKQAARLRKIPAHSLVYDILNRDHIYIAENATSDPLFKSSRFTRDEQIISCAGIPLKMGQESVGVLFINYRSSHRFTESELINIELFANQAAVAIRNAQWYEGVQKQARVLSSLHEAGQAITSALELKDLLYRLAEQAAQLMSHTSKFTGFADIITVSDEMNATFVAAYPRRALQQTHKILGKEIDLIAGKDGRIGLVGRAIKTEAPQLVKDVIQDPDYLMSHRSTRSELVVPIKAGGKVIGVINVEHPMRDAFDQEHLRALELLAAQSGIAMQNAQLYEQERRRVVALEALYQAGRVVTSSLDLDKILSSIAEQAWVLTGTSGKQALFCHIALVEVNILVFKATYPPEHLLGLQTDKGRIDLDHATRIGVVGRTFKTGRSQLVGDITGDLDYLPYNSDTHSELAVPIKLEEKLIGVINVEHTDPHAFDDTDMHVLETLAAQAAVAIQNAYHYQELKQTQIQLSTRTQMGLMGIVNTNWRHGIVKDVQTIREQIQLLRQNLNETSSAKNTTQWIERLDTITRLVNQLHAKPTIPPLSDKEGLELVAPNQLIQERVQQLWQNDPYRKIQHQFDLHLSDNARVQANPQWLRQALDNLIDNAVKAVSNSLQKIVIIGTHCIDHNIAISITDTGTGIPEGVRSKLGVDFIEKSEGETGLGMGVMLAQTIIQTYRGDIRVKKTDATGTTIVIQLPLAS